MIAEPSTTTNAMTAVAAIAITAAVEVWAKRRMLMIDTTPMIATRASATANPALTHAGVVRVIEAPGCVAARPTPRLVRSCERRVVFRQPYPERCREDQLMAG